MKQWFLVLHEPWQSPPRFGLMRASQKDLQHLPHHPSGGNMIWGTHLPHPNLDAPLGARASCRRAAVGTCRLAAAMRVETEASQHCGAANSVEAAMLPLSPANPFACARGQQTTTMCWCSRHACNPHPSMRRSRKAR